MRSQGILYWTRKIIDLGKFYESISDDGGSDSSADDGLPLHLEHLAKNVCTLLIFKFI